MGTEQEREKYQRASMLYSQGDYGGALAILEELLRSFPNEKHLEAAKAKCLSQLRPLGRHRHPTLGKRTRILFLGALGFSAVVAGVVGTMSLLPKHAHPSAGGNHDLTEVSAVSESDARASSAEQMTEKATRFEDERDWISARSAWERVIDTCDHTDSQRLEAVARLRDLNSKVPPNTDYARANVWRAKAFVFCALDYQWLSEGGKNQRHVHISFSNTEIEYLRNAFAQFGETAFRFSRGFIRVDCPVEIIDQPLTKLTRGADEKFWLSPDDARNLLTGRCARGQLDSAFAVVKVNDGGSQDVPRALLGGSYGPDTGLNGAGFNCILLTAGDLSMGSDLLAEVALHEWLHIVDFAFAKRVYYPEEIVPSSDDGRMEGESGGDIDYRRQTSDKDWLGYYRHIMSEHITSKMWLELRCRRPEEVAVPWLVLGPFSYKLPLENAINETHWDCSKEPTAGEQSDGVKWRYFPAFEGECVDLIVACGHGDYAMAYASAVVETDRDCEAFAWLGYDDSMILYVNGTEVHRYVGSHQAKLDEVSVRVTLHKGRNTVILKVLNIGGGWGFFARLADAKGRPITGVHWVS